MKCNMDQWSKAIIDKKTRDVFPVLYFPCLGLSKMGIIETMEDGKKMATAMEKILEKFPTMNAIATGMDLTVDAEAFGAAVTFKDNEAPSVRQALIETSEEAAALKVPPVHSGRVDVFLEAVAEAKKTITHCPVLGGQLGPFSLAANLLEVQTALKSVRKNPEILKELLEKSTKFLTARALAYKEAGADGIFLAEPTAGLLSPKQCQEFSSVYVKKIVEAVQDSDFYVILHNCGYVTQMVDSMYATGCKGFHFGNAVNMEEILPKIPTDVLVYGNIDPSSDFTNGTPEKIYAKTTALLKSTAEYPHFILSSGCDIPPLAPMENIEAFFKACADYNQEL